MTRQIVRLDSNTTQQSINLEFDAEILSVINPTAQSIGVSVGGNIPPQTVQSADIWIPADSGINYPVVGRNFAAAFMPPLLVNAPTGIPTAANLFFTAQEPVPNFGAFPLSTLATQSLADVSLYPSNPIPTGTGIDTHITLTPDIQSITVLYTAQNLSRLDVFGDTTGVQYIGAIPHNASASLQSATVSAWTANIAYGLESSLHLIADVSATPGSGGVSIIGHRYSSPLTTSITNAQLVAVDTSLAPVRVNPTWARQPDYSAYQLQLNPALNQYIATINGIPNGIYRIEWDISCESPTGAAAKKAYLIDTTNGRTLAGVPFPGSRSGVITAYGPGNAFALAVLNGIAITDGSYLHGAIRAWKL